MYDCLDSQRCYYEPPLLACLMDSQIGEYIPNKTALTAPRIVGLPCHSQAVKQAVVLLTKAAASMCGHDGHLKFILATLVSKELILRLSSKASYRLKLYIMLEKWVGWDRMKFNL